jgi:integral membrane protein (TIGR01906 family)
MTRRWEVALLALALAAFGVIQAVYVFAGEDTYRDLARGRGQVTFVTPTARLTTDESGLVDLHRRTLGYVLGDATEPPRLSEGTPLFDANERGHLADVRGIFGALRVAWALAGILLVALLLRLRSRGRLARTLRTSALIAGAVVLAIGLAFAVAFEPAFLAFHYLFFPQGNFLFDPATSNLLRLYPEEYWYGVTLRIGLSFVVTALALAGVTTLTLRMRGAR